MHCYIGISMIFVISYRTNSSSLWCNLQIGLLICPTLVSILSVGLIAIDRYIFILHGLYYQRWFNTTRVRIGIICTWIVGMILGFMPITGWKNTEMRHIKCYYFSLFPGIIIMINGLLSMISILIVAVLNIILLVHALRNVELLKGKHYNKNTDNKLRKFRGPTIQNENRKNTMKKSASFDLKVTNISIISNNELRSKSLNTLSVNNKSINMNKSNSDMSIFTLANSVQDVDLSKSNEINKVVNNKRINTSKNYFKKHKEPSKWRAIIVITLTSGSFLITWLPYFMTSTVYELCEHKFKNSRCIDLRFTLRGPLGLFGYFNSVLNPLIYAWWHKGFKRFLKNYYSRLYLECFNK